MIATIAGTALASVGFIITSLRRNTNSNHQRGKRKGEPGGSPFRYFTVSPPKRAKSTYVSRATRTAKAVCLVVVQL